VYPASSDAGEEADDADRKGAPRTPNLASFLDDPDAYLVNSIEIYNEETVVGYSFRGSAAGASEWGAERRHTNSIPFSYETGSRNRVRLRAGKR